MTTAAPRQDRVLTFSAGGQTLAIPVDDVAEVAPLPRVTRVPQAPPALAGLTSLRGRVLPVLSMDRLLGPDGCDTPSRLIVLRGAHSVGLAVDSIRAMREVERQTDEADGAALVETADGVTRLLDLESLIQAAFAGVQRQTRSLRHDSAMVDTATTAAPIQEVAFLEFQVAGQAYALPLEQVREVTTLPQATTALPRTDAVMVGVAPHRGELLALVSVRAVLGLPAAEATCDARVVVVALGEARLGLVVDHVRAILRAPEGDVGAVPSVLNRGAGEARIDAIVRTPGGLVSVLAAERILEEESVAQVIAEASGRRSGAADTAAVAAGAIEQFVLFRLADETYGLPIGAIVEVVRLPETVVRVPRAPPFVSGVMNHRGAVVPLIDQNRRFVTPPGGEAGQRRVIVVRLDDLVAGFIVDEVEQILNVHASDLQAAPDLAAADTPVFDRIATLDLDGRLVLLVDPRQLLDQAERDIVRELAEGANPEPA